MFGRGGFRIPAFAGMTVEEAGMTIIKPPKLQRYPDQRPALRAAAMSRAVSFGGSAVSRMPSTHLTLA